MTEDAKSAMLDWKQRLLLVLFGALVLFLALFQWQDTQRESLRNARVRFEAQADKISVELAQEFSRLATVLDAGAAFWTTSPEPSRRDWEAFVGQIDPWRGIQGLNAFTFARPVASTDLDAFVADMRKSVATDFSVHGYQHYPQAGQILPDPQDDVFVITHFEPYGRYRDTLLGLNLGGEQTRRAAAEASRDSGNLVISDPVQMITSSSVEGPDFIAFAPVYRRGFPLLTVEQRRVAHFGWVTLGLNGNALAQDVFSSARANGYDIALALQVGQGSVAEIIKAQSFNADRDVGHWQEGFANEFIHLLRSLMGAAHIHTERSLAAGGKHWVIQVHSTPQLESSLFENPWGPLLLHVGLSLALIAAFGLILYSRQQSKILASQAIARLTSEERRYASVVEGTAEGYWEIDPITRRTTSVNRSLCAMLGYEKHEILGQTPAFFCDPESREILREHLEAVWTTTHRRFEITFLRKSGLPLNALVAGTTLRDENGNVASVFAMVTDLTEIVKMRQALTEKTKALEATNSDLQQFAYVASHDLQAPIRSVSSYLQLLERRYSGKLDGEAREFIRFAVDGAHRMSQLVNDLLSFSRLETRSGELQPTSLDGCLDRALANLEVAIGTTGASVVRPGSLPMVLGDRGQLTSLFQNIVGNALKYVPPDRTPDIHISVREMDREIEISIADNGIGIPADQYERIFLIFQRLHGPTEYEGTGIGLALCKKIVDHHRGKIWIEPNHLEDGTEQGVIFKVSLPTTTARRAAPLPAWAMQSSERPKV